ncbi:MAG TPA: endonuclease/exonuclease/phosphatase family protein [Steroidobacteraceae bacterium]|nr:endonuclease/exonuclease/phosphatase family protein [Steroidobacteraceae bacterium]
MTIAARYGGSRPRVFGRFARALALLASLLAGSAVQVAGAAESGAVAMPQGTALDHSDGAPLKVVTLNLAHGRKDAINQLLVSRASVEQNLAEIAELLRKVGADVVALQEADGPSRWSGGFDHVERLASQAGYPWYFRSSHARTWLFDYGTALLSRLPFTEEVGAAFEPTPPSMTKGLSIGRMTWRPSDNSPPVPVDIVSVHLDFSRESVRNHQMQQMAEILDRRVGPLIVLGDFNSDWFDEASVVAEFAHRCGMQAYAPSHDGLGTYRSNGRRLDWVLISSELEFLDHRVMPQVVSDHQAVVAVIGLRGEAVLMGPGGHARARCST